MWCFSDDACLICVHLMTILALLFWCKSLLFDYQYYNKLWNFYCHYFLIWSILHQTTYICIIWRDIHNCYSWDDIEWFYFQFSYLGSLLHFRLYYISQSLNSITLQYMIWCSNVIVWWNLMYLILYRVMHFNSVWHMCVSECVGCRTYIILKCLAQYES